MCVYFGSACLATECSTCRVWGWMGRGRARASKTGRRLGNCARNFVLALSAAQCKEGRSTHLPRPPLIDISVGCPSTRRSAARVAASQEGRRRRRGAAKEVMLSSSAPPRPRLIPHRATLTLHTLQTNARLMCSTSHPLTPTLPRVTLHLLRRQQRPRALCPRRPPSRHHAGLAQVRLKQSPP